MSFSWSLKALTPVVGSSRSLYLSLGTLTLHLKLLSLLAREFMDGCLACFGGLVITFTGLYNDEALLGVLGARLLLGAGITGFMGSVEAKADSLILSFGMGGRWTGGRGGEEAGSCSCSGLESLLLLELLSESLELLELELELLLELLEDLLWLFSDPLRDRNEVLLAWLVWESLLETLP